MKLRELRQSKGMSQAELVQAVRNLGAKISAAEVSVFENHGGYLPPAYKRAIATILGVKPEDLE